MALVACLWISKCCYQDWCIGLGTFLPRKGVGKHALGTLGKTESAYSDLIKFLWKDEQVHPHPVALTQWEHLPTAFKISLRKSRIFWSVMSLGSRQKETWVTFYELFFFWGVAVFLQFTRIFSNCSHRLLPHICHSPSLCFAPRRAVILNSWTSLLLPGGRSWFPEAAVISRDLPCLTGNDLEVMHLVWGILQWLLIRSLKLSPSAEVLTNISSWHCEIFKSPNLSLSVQL